jgi:hypothetical protein
MWLWVVIAAHPQGPPGYGQVAALEEHTRLLAAAIGRHERAKQPARSLELVIGIRG